jgi:hypothetical protein
MNPAAVDMLLTYRVQRIAQIPFDVSHFPWIAEQKAETPLK